MAGDEDSSSQDHWESFLDALIADRELLTQRVRDSIRPRLAAYRRVGDRELEWGFRLDLDAVLTSARAGYEAVTDEQLAALTPVGEARARQGIPIADVLLAWRIGVQVVIDRATEMGPELDISEAEMLRFVRALIGASDRAMAIIASAHRTADLELATREAERARACGVVRRRRDARIRRHPRRGRPRRAYAARTSARLSGSLPTTRGPRRDDR
jgi:hypothetical protein